MFALGPAPVRPERQQSYEPDDLAAEDAHDDDVPEPL
jgi:hypothetical protein